MNKKKIIYAISFLLTIIIILSSTRQVLATGVSGIKPSSSQTGSFKKAMKVTIGIFQVAAIGVGAVMLIALAIKYMSSSPSDKAEIKKHAAIYILGAVLAFSASGIAEIIKKFTTDVAGKVGR